MEVSTLGYDVALDTMIYFVLFTKFEKIAIKS